MKHRCVVTGRTPYQCIKDLKALCFAPHPDALVTVLQLSTFVTALCADVFVTVLSQAPALAAESKLKNIAKLQLPSQTILSGSLTNAQLGDRDSMLHCNTAYCIIYERESSPRVTLVDLTESVLKCATQHENWDSSTHKKRAGFCIADAVGVGAIVVCATSLRPSATLIMSTSTPRGLALTSMPPIRTAI